MAGHSKWAQIKRQKAVSDAAKSRAFSRYARIITLESRRVGPGSTSPALTVAIARAKEANMPKDNIERAITKGVAKDTTTMESAQYELYGPGGTAMVIITITDNKNRTLQELKQILAKHNVSIATPGSALWAFVKHADGTLTPNDSGITLSPLECSELESALSALDEQDDVQHIYTNAVGYEDTGD